ncbi:MAG: hypothetical protein ACRDRZ_13240 [Pseudonocardiaceae bacterium]
MASIAWCDCAQVASTNANASASGVGYGELAAQRVLDELAQRLTPSPGSLARHRQQFVRDRHCGAHDAHGSHHLHQDL